MKYSYISIFSRYNKKNYYRVLFISTAIILLSIPCISCGNPEDTQSSPALSQNSVALTLGGSQQTISISGGLPPYILSNSNAQVVKASNASQNNSIVLTPQKEGTATITVSGSDGGSTRLQVTVTN